MPIDDNRKAFCSTVLKNEDFCLFKRDEICHQLDKFLNQTGRVLVFAPAGYGKSSSVLAYTQSLEKSSRVIHYFYADTDEKLLDGFTACLGINVTMAKAEISRRLVKFMNEQAAKIAAVGKSVLLVFENVSESVLASCAIDLNWLSATVKLILISDQLLSLSSQFKPVEARLLSRPECERFFSEQVNNRIENLAHVVCEAELSAFDMSKVVYQIKSNKLRNEEISVELVRAFVSRFYTDLVVKMNEITNLTDNVLQFLALCDPDCVELDFFKETVLMSRGVEAEIADSENEDELESVLLYLKKFGLIQLKDDAGSRLYFSTHRQFQAELAAEVLSKNRINDEQQLEVEKKLMIKNMILCVNKRFPRRPRRQSKYSTYVYQASHLVVHIDQAKMKPSCSLGEEFSCHLARLFENLGQFSSRVWQDHRKAFDLLMRALELCKHLEVREDGNEQVARVLCHIGRVYYHLAEFNKCLDYELKSLELLMRMHKGELHVDIALLLYNIGKAYNRLGDSNKALEYLNQSLEARNRLYNDNHADIAGSLSKIGKTYFSLGYFHLALAYYRQALEMSKKIYSEAHVTIANSLANIAATYSKLGDFNEVKLFPYKI